MKYFLIGSFFVSVLTGQSGYDIAKKLDEKEQPKDLTNRTSMVLTNSKGKTRTNTMISKSMDRNRRQMIWFLEPKDDKGVAFLKIEHDDGNDEMRMWLPAFKKVRRISSSKKSDSFMGSDLSYEDMTSRELSENTYNRLEDDVVDGRECYVLEIIPSEKLNSSYSKHISWVIKDGLLGLKEESYDKRGELKKKKEFQYKRLKDYHVIERIYVKDMQKNHTTEIMFKSIEVDSGIEKNLFQEKNLKRLPKK